MTDSPGIAPAAPEAPAVALLRRVQSAMSRPPAISWGSSLQPVPLHRARVVLPGGRIKSHGHLEDADLDYREELRILWLAARLGRRPLDGDLLVAMTFIGRTGPRRRQRPDLSNLVKAVEDAGNPTRDGGWRGLWNDDAQIAQELVGIVDWRPGAQPLVTLDVWRLG